MNRPADWSLVVLSLVAAALVLQTSRADSPAKDSAQHEGWLRQIASSSVCDWATARECVLANRDGTTGVLAKAVGAGQFVGKGEALARGLLQETSQPAIGYVWRKWAGAAQPGIVDGDVVTRVDNAPVREGPWRFIRVVTIPNTLNPSIAFGPRQWDSPVSLTVWRDSAFTNISARPPYKGLEGFVHWPDLVQKYRLYGKHGDWDASVEEALYRHDQAREETLRTWPSLPTLKSLQGSYAIADRIELRAKKWPGLPLLTAAWNQGCRDRLAFCVWQFEQAVSLMINTNMPGNLEQQRDSLEGSYPDVFLTHIMTPLALVEGLLLNGQPEDAARFLDNTADLAQQAGDPASAAFLRARCLFLLAGASLWDSALSYLQNHKQELGLGVLTRLGAAQLAARAATEKGQADDALSLLRDLKAQTNALAGPASSNRTAVARWQREVLSAYARPVSVESSLAASVRVASGELQNDFQDGGGYPAFLSTSIEDLVTRYSQDITMSDFFGKPGATAGSATNLALLRWIPIRDLAKRMDPSRVMTMHMVPLPGRAADVAFESRPAKEVNLDSVVGWTYNNNLTIALIETESATRDSAFRFMFRVTVNAYGLMSYALPDEEWRSPGMGDAGRAQDWFPLARIGCTQWQRMHFRYEQDGVSLWINDRLLLRENVPNAKPGSKLTIYVSPSREFEVRNLGISAMTSLPVDNEVIKQGFPGLMRAMEALDEDGIRTSRLQLKEAMESVPELRAEWSELDAAAQSVADLLSTNGIVLSTPERLELRSRKQGRASEEGSVYEWILRNGALMPRVSGKPREALMFLYETGIPFSSGELSGVMEFPVAVTNPVVCLIAWNGDFLNARSCIAWHPDSGSVILGEFSRAPESKGTLPADMKEYPFHVQFNGESATARIGSSTNNQIVLRATSLQKTGNEIVLLYQGFPADGYPRIRDLRLRVVPPASTSKQTERKPER